MKDLLRRALLIMAALMMVMTAGAAPARADGKPTLVPKVKAEGLHLRGETFDVQYTYTPAYVYETLCLQVIGEDQKIAASSYYQAQNESTAPRVWTVHIDTEKMQPGKYEVVTWVRVLYEGQYKHYSKKTSEFQVYGWKQAGSQWAWVTKEGTSPKAEWMDIEGKRYYFTTKGYRKTGWLKQSGKRYYFDPEGVMLTKWQTIDGAKYYFDKEGVMMLGWTKLGGKWYYFDDGKMVTGKKEIDGVTQTFDKKGVWQGEGEPPEPLPLPKKVSLSETKAKIAVGEKLKLKAEISPAGANPSVTWTSSDEKVAKVNAKGSVTGVAAGKATITVRTANGKTATCEIQVTAPAVKKITLSKKGTVSLKVGEKLTLKTFISPEGASSKLTWTSSDKKVATVNSKGVVKAVAKGTAVITVKTKNGKTAEVKIKVK